MVTNWAYVISSGAKDNELAAKWIQFLTSEEAQRAWTIETGELPARVNLLEDPVLLESEPLLAAPLASLNSSIPYPFEALAQMDTAIRNAIQKVTIGGEDAQKAFTALAKEAETIYIDVVLDDLY